MKISLQPARRALYQTVSATSVILRLGFPAAFVTVACFGRLANLTDCVLAVLLCMIVTSLSWMAGQAMKHVVD